MPYLVAADHPAHGKTQVNQAATAYVCHNRTCSAPVTDPAQVVAVLSR